MRPPPFLVGAALLFWGFEADWLMFALFMATVLEAAHWVRWRWEFSSADLNRIWDLCAVLFVGALIIRYTSDELTGASAYQFFQWFPLLFFPIMAAQTFGNRDGIPLTVFSWFLRLRQSRSQEAIAAVPVGYLYVLACIVSAGASNRRDPWFFIGVVILCGWALWNVRSRRFGSVVWMASYIVAVLVAYFGQLGLRELQDIFEGRVSLWVARLTGHGFDANETRTALGTIGMRKQSGRIVMRVEPNAGRMNSLLRQASYDSFRDTMWLASRVQFDQVPAEADATTWPIQPATNALNAMTVYTSLPGRAGSLSLPIGATRIENLSVASLETNSFGATRVTEAPGLIGYKVRYSDDAAWDQAPAEVDLQLPERERAALNQIVEELGLEVMPVNEKIRTIQAFFEKNFSYSLFVPENVHRPNDSDTPLSRFLFRSRKGHCEYFATATTLLLRAAQVPARYATGYSVQEPTRGRAMYVVRSRHAHAWTLVWNNGRWEDLDTTPGSWVSTEEQRASIFEGMADLWSAIRFQFLKWRWLSRRGLFQEMAPWLLAPLVIYLSWRLFVRRKRVDLASLTGGGHAEVRPGLDSDFYRVERQLARVAGERPSEVPLGRWLELIRGPVAVEGSGSESRPLDQRQVSTDKNIPVRLNAGVIQGAGRATTPVAEASSPECSSEVALRFKRPETVTATRSRDGGAAIDPRFESHPVNADARQLVCSEPDSSKLPIEEDELDSLLALHYRYRFDPEGLSAEDRESLRIGVDRWLRSQSNGPAK